jgi:antitoxin HigA-1
MTRFATHPGEHIADELEAQDLSASQLARTLHIPTNRLTEIIRGRRGISADTALRLAWWLGTSPEYWMNLQRNYELRLAEQARGDEIRREITPLPTPASAA